MEFVNASGRYACFFFLINRLDHILIDHLKKKKNSFHSSTTPPIVVFFFPLYGRCLLEIKKKTMDSHIHLNACACMLYIKKIKNNKYESVKIMNKKQEQIKTPAYITKLR